MRKVIYAILIVLFIVINIILVGILIVDTGEYVGKINRNEIQVEEENTEDIVEQDMDLKEIIKKLLFKKD